MKVKYRDQLEDDDRKTIINGLNEQALTKRGIGKNNGSFSFSLIDTDDQFIGGIEGYNYCGCCHIDIFFIQKEYRSLGHGISLIKKAEDLAKERGCLFMSLNTMDYEAKPFYEKQGFKVEFTREGFEGDSVMYLMKKVL